MKFTSENLMNAMGLQVGDRIVLDNGSVYEVAVRNSEISLQYLESKYLNTVPTPKKFEWFSLGYLYNKDYEILPRPKRVGDTLCKDCECVECHLRCLPHCNQLDSAKKTLFNILDGWNEYGTFDQEIYDLLKARLDKEVE